MARHIRERALRLVARYGPAGAAAVVLATVAMAAVPVPGAVLIPVTVAETIRHRRA